MSQCIISASINLSSHRNLAGVTAGKWLWQNSKRGYLYREHHASSSGYKGYSAVTPGREFRDASRQGVSHTSELAMAFGLKVKGMEVGAGSFGRRDIYLSVKHGQG